MDWEKFKEYEISLKIKFLVFMILQKGALPNVYLIFHYQLHYFISPLPMTLLQKKI